MSNPYADYEMPETQGIFFKFEDGKENRVRIASPEPLLVESIFDEGGPRESFSTKYHYVIINRATNAAQIMQLPGGAFSQILAYAKDPDYGNPQSYDLKITRTGTGIETKYEIIAGRTNSDLTEAEQEAAAQIDLKGQASKGKGYQRGYWLSETKKQEPDHTKDVETLKEIGNQTQSHADNMDIEDEVDDKPLDLSEIPF